jgi:hypothetical protein
MPYVPDPIFENPGEKSKSESPEISHLSWLAFETKPIRKTLANPIGANIENITEFAVAFLIQ